MGRKAKHRNLSGIYQIQSKANPERKYIGSSRRTGRRWVEHLFLLRKGEHHSKKLQRHYNKYGEADLSFSILLGCSEESRIEIEQFFFDTYRPYFNSVYVAEKSVGNQGRKGRPLTEEHKRKISEAQRGEKNSMYKTDPWNKGKKGTPSPNKGKKGIYSEETLAKMRISNQRAADIRKLKKIA